MPGSRRETDSVTSGRWPLIGLILIAAAAFIYFVLIPIVFHSGPVP